MERRWPGGYSMAARCGYGALVTSLRAGIFPALLAGIFPALRAANLPASEALRAA